MVSLEQLKFRDLLAWIIIQCTTVDSIDLKTKDRVLSAAIKLVNLVYFRSFTHGRATLNEGSLKPSISV